MNTFAKMILVQRFSKVCYYTVQIEGEDSLFQQFLNKHTYKNTTKLNHIMAWLQVIGNKVGAYPEYFRNEAETADTVALPPVGANREPTYVEFDEMSGQDENTSNDLRLYCLRANENVVFLLNGDIKTARKAQDCDNVRPHFRMANALTKTIGDAFKNKDIKWNDDLTDIVFDYDFEINLLT